MQAMQEYKYQSGRMFPTWSEVLEVLRDLGYEKRVDLLPSEASRREVDGSPRFTRLQIADLRARNGDFRGEFRHECSRICNLQSEIRNLESLLSAA